MREGADARLVEQLGADACRRLGESCLALIGAGTLGGAFSAHAAMLGVRQRIVDVARIEPQNLGAQAFPDACLGDEKSAVRAWQAKLLNSDCIVEPLAARIEDLGLARLAGSGLLVSALDSRLSRMRVNDISRRLGIPMIDLAVGNADQGLIASVALYTPRAVDSVCFSCRIRPADLAAVSREGRGACRSWRDASRPVTPHTLASSALAAITAGYGMLWAIEVLSGRGEPLAGRMLVLQGLPPRLRLVRIEASKRCVHDHRCYLPLREADDDTLGDVLEDATAKLHGTPDALVFAGRTLALGLRCASCGSQQGLVRIAQAVSDEEAHCECGSPDEMVPLRLTDRLSGEEAGDLAEFGWQELGVPLEDVVVAERGEERLAYRVHRLVTQEGRA